VKISTGVTKHPAETSFVKISTGVTYKTSSRNEFRENSLGDSHTLLKASTTFLSALSTLLDP